MAQLTEAFLSSNIMVPVSIPTGWQAVLLEVVPMTTGALNEQFVEAQDQLNAILTAGPPSNVDPLNIILPITLINNLKEAFATFEYQYGILPKNSFQYTVEEIHSVFDDYSVSFYNGPFPPKNGYFIY